MPYAGVSHENIKAALSHLPEGNYATADLYPHYEEWAKTQDQAPVAYPVFATVLLRSSCLESIRKGGTRIWYVERRALDCRNWFERTKGAGVETPPSPVAS